MHRLMFTFVGFIAGVSMTSLLQVEKKGQTAKVLFEHEIQGHLTDLNGKYKLRLSETVYENGGYIGAHHHAGPGIRMIEEGQLRYVQPDKTTIYKPGDCFFESGDVSHTAYNDGPGQVKLLNFEILPANWQGGSAMPVPKSGN